MQPFEFALVLVTTVAYEENRKYLKLVIRELRFRAIGEYPPPIPLSDSTE